MKNRDPIVTNGAAVQRRFQFVLIKPSHYDDDGYVIRWWRSIIPSNSLAALYSIGAPLPGSEDHQKLWQQCVAMDPDLNKYDTNTTSNMSARPIRV